MRLVTLQQASADLGISVTTLRRRIYAGNLPFTRSNTATMGKILVDLDAVQQVLQSEAIANQKSSVNKKNTANPINTAQDTQSEVELFDVASLVAAQRKAMVAESFTGFVSSRTKPNKEGAK